MEYLSREFDLAYFSRIEDHQEFLRLFKIESRKKRIQKKLLKRIDSLVSVE